MASATLVVRDTTDDNGQPCLDMDVTFNPEVDNHSLAHQTVAKFIAFANSPLAAESELDDGQGTPLILPD